MRWGRKNVQNETVTVAPPPATFWTDRFAAIGARLDDSKHDLNEVAVSVTGSEIRVTALGWDPSVHFDGWRSVFAEMTLDELTIGAVRTARLWEQRLHGVGAFLDGKDHPVFSPCVLAVKGGLLISALISVEDAFVPVSWHLYGGQSA